MMAGPDRAFDALGIISSVIASMIKHDKAH
jgi:hypothetical protein